MKNTLKAKLKRGETVIGTFVGIGHPDIAEWLSRQGFDFLLLDSEHSPMGFETMQVMLQAMNGSGCTPIIRPQWNDPVIIKRCLDIGAHGLLIPWVNSKEDAEAAVRACKYPPQGLRGFGPRRPRMLDADYYATANDEILITVQIETEQALKNLDDILSVPSIDACYVGPFDLSCSMGFGIPPKWDEPRYLAAFDQVIKASRKHNIPAGMFTLTDNVKWAIEKGFRFNTVDDADKFLVNGAQMALAAARKAKPPRKR